jgi:hypothetical protein
MCHHEKTWGDYVLENWYLYWPNCMGCILSCLGTFHLVVSAHPDSLRYVPAFTSFTVPQDSSDNFTTLSSRYIVILFFVYSYFPKRWFPFGFKLKTVYVFSCVFQCMLWRSLIRWRKQCSEKSTCKICSWRNDFKYPYLLIAGDRYMIFINSSLPFSVLGLYIILRILFRNALVKPFTLGFNTDAVGDSWLQYLWRLH